MSCGSTVIWLRCSCLANPHPAARTHGRVCGCKRRREEERARERESRERVENVCSKCAAEAGEVVEMSEQSEKAIETEACNIYIYIKHTI